MISQTHEQQAAALHDCTRRISHPDSEDAVRIERQRIARELTSYIPNASTQVASRTSNLEDEVPSTTRLSIHRSSISFNAPLQSHESLESYATTLQKCLILKPAPSARSTGMIHWRTSGPHMLGTIASHRELYSVLSDQSPSLTIDEGAHRDHLGMLSCNLSRQFC